MGLFLIMLVVWKRPIKDCLHLKYLRFHCCLHVDLFTHGWQAIGMSLVPGIFSEKALFSLSQKKYGIGLIEVVLLEIWEIINM